MSRVLLVSPAFHGYWRSIAGALERRGHTVRTCRYDERGPVGKVRHRLHAEVAERRGAAGAPDAGATRRAVEALAERPEAVVVVKGDALAPAFWDRLDSDRTPRVLWAYDELRRMRYAADTLARVGPVASYSHHDVAELTRRGLVAAYLPLAHDPHLARAHPTGPDSDEVVFVGARYPRRAALLTGLAAAGVPVRAYGRDWSRHLVDVVRTRGAQRPELPAGRDLDRADGYAAMAAALATLNVHGDQDGFTMRTFEACGVGAVQLVDRADVAEVYEPDRELVVFDGPDDLLEQVGRVRADPAWARGLREQGARRTLAEHTFDHRVGRLEELWRAWG